MPPLLNRSALLLALIAGFGLPGQGRIRSQVETQEVEIAEPAPGSAVQGTLSIVGTAAPEDFFFYELSFRYTGGPEDPWFVIAESFNPVSNGTLGEWDTFAITDGNYDLRLLVILTDATEIEHRVEGIRVRNYSPIETSTAGPSATATITQTPDLTALFTPSATATMTTTPAPRATFTPLPPNPAEIESGEISTSLARGAAGVLAVFLLIGLYTSIRNLRRR